MSPDAPGVWGGGGTVMLRCGHLLGGDDQYFWQGSYNISADDKVTAEVRARLHSGNASSIFGSFGDLKLTEFVVDFEGGAQEDGVYRLVGQVRGHDGLKMIMRLSR